MQCRLMLLNTEVLCVSSQKLQIRLAWIYSFNSDNNYQKIIICFSHKNYKFSYFISIK